MDDAYRAYFRQRVSEFEEFETYWRLPRPSRGYEPHPVADEAVRAALLAARSAVADGAGELRGDAQLLLFLLARELVARPVSAVRPEESGQLASDLTHDVTAIVRRAMEASPSGDVSAHRVIDALSRTWDELRSGRYALWDRSRNATSGSE